MEKSTIILACTLFCALAITCTQASSCPCGWVLLKNNCYHLYQFKKSWNDAKTFCESKNAHLAYIPDVETNTFLTNENEDNENVWIGLNDIYRENTYVWTWSTHPGPSYRHWARGEPTNRFSNVDCVHFGANKPSYWAVSICTLKYDFFCQKPAANDDVARDCDRVRGIIQSPNYPSNYFDKEDLKWTIHVPQGSVIKLTFAQPFSLEIAGGCKYDYLQIYYVTSQGHRNLQGKWCGNVPPLNMISSASKVEVVFHSDDGTNGKGFSISWNIVENSGICSCTQKGKNCDDAAVNRCKTGIIQSPNYPSDYDSDEYLKWTINVPEGFHINLTITRPFNLESMHGLDYCKYDSLKIFYVTSDGTRTLRGNWCETPPPNMISSTSRVEVEFKSDNTNSYSGFSILWSGVDIDECKNSNGGCEQICTNTEGSFNCSCASGFTFNGVNCEEVYGSCSCTNHGQNCDNAIVRLCDRGIIQTPNYPSTYNQNEDLEWTIDAPLGFLIHLRFAKVFEMEQNHKCTFDSLKIYDETSDGIKTLMGTWCGKTAPDDMMLSTSKVKVEFHSDNSNDRKGFSISWHAVDSDECEINNGGCKQICTNTAGSFHCSCNPGYVLNGLNCYDLDECTINNGGCEHICTNTVGSFHCSCNPGYVLNGLNCYVDQNCSCTTGNGQSCNDDVVKKCNEGIVQSPNYPLTYNTGRDLTWTIEVPDGFRINLTFAKLFEFESHTRCSYDYLKIYEVASDGNRILKGTWCGRTAPPDMISLTSKVEVIFHSDNSGVRKGFSMSWNRVDIDECKVNNGACEQVCTNTEGSWTCSSYETASSCPCGWVLFKNNCYHLYQFKKPWNDAKTFCNSQNAHLASIFDAETNIFLSNENEENQNVWIGLNDLDTEDYYHWIGDPNTYHPYRPWAKDQPNNYKNQDCVHFWDEQPSYWADTACSTKYYFFCQKPASHDAIVKKCDGGIIQTPNFPSPYNIQEDLKWTIDVPQGFRVKLTFDKRFELEGNSQCYDYLKINYESSNGHKVLKGTWCKTVAPPDMITSSSKVEVVFHSDASNNRGGFSITWQLVDIDECDLINGGCEQRCNNTEGSYHCFCDNGYTKDGTKCSDIDECYVNNGGCEQRCINTGGSFHCSCDTGYTKNGLNCNDNDECAVNNGGCQQRCTNTIGSWNCSCDIGYNTNGQNCSDIDECAITNGGCEHICTNTIGSWNCSCHSGHAKNEQSCHDIDECRDNNGGCEQICTNSIGSFYCSCHSGYTKDGQSCHDIDECQARHGGCEQICTNTEGSWNCSCDAGYTINGQSCDDIDECKVNNGGCEQTCTNTVGSWKCSCGTGYTSIGLKCEDIDECQVNNGGCQQTCTNTIGAWNCSCNTGYTKNSTLCDDIDECRTGNDGCEQICTNTIGSWNCSCHSGYTSIDQKCEDIDECQVNNGGCQQICTNTEGSRNCSCDIGYTTNGQNCVDIDECKIKNGGCEQICTNTEGSRNCSCDIGYTTNGHNCDDIDECKIKNGGCEQICTNTEGSRNCSCNVGYTKNVQKCEDIDECKIHNGGCQQICTNSIGSWNCSCHTGYMKHGQSCDDIDECQVNNGECQQICTNTEGSRNCSCNSGYTINGQRCDDIDECKIKNGGCEQICTNTEGSRNCSCNVGYTKNVQKCEDIDECTVGNGGCEQICTNSIGSWNCSCHSGYMKHGQSCDVVTTKETTNPTTINTETEDVSMKQVTSSISSVSGEAQKSQSQIAGLHYGAFAGIIGGILVLIVIVTGSVLVMKRRRRRTNIHSPSEGYQNAVYNSTTVQTLKMNDVGNAVYDSTTVQALELNDVGNAVYDSTTVQALELNDVGDDILSDC